MAITGMHAILYSKKAEATRAFFGDVLGLPSVDAGRGWLIFAAPPSEVAVHPAEEEEFHQLYLMCDDIEATLEEMRAKNVVTGPIQDQPWGRLSHLVLPSGEQLGIYQPKHPTAFGLQRT
jgi:predicted enzyme related to lactoylglutathione lyase